MAITTASRRSSTANLLQLFLSSLSPESKVIAKAAGGGGGGRRQLVAGDNGGGGGAFRCRTCGRCFTTFQALGGHRTSHNRPRVRAAGLDLLLGARPGKVGATSDVHRCNTCGMVFATGQALGGHMRRHRAAVAALFDVAAAAGAAPESTVTTSGGSDDEDDDNAGHLPSTLIKFI